MAKETTVLLSLDKETNACARIPAVENRQANRIPGVQYLGNKVKTRFDEGDGLKYAVFERGPTCRFKAAEYLTQDRGRYQIPDDFDLESIRPNLGRKKAANANITTANEKKAGVGHTLTYASAVDPADAKKWAERLPPITDEVVAEKLAIENIRAIVQATKEMVNNPASSEAKKIHWKLRGDAGLIGHCLAIRIITDAMEAKSGKPFNYAAWRASEQVLSEFCPEAFKPKKAAVSASEEPDLPEDEEPDLPDEDSYQLIESSKRAGWFYRLYPDGHKESWFTAEDEAR